LTGYKITFVFHGFYFLLCSHTGQPTITIEEGTSVTLKCTALANPPCNFTWVKENSSHVETGEQLHIREFKESHAGSYHCKATNIHGTAKSAGVTLKVQGEHQQCIMVLLETLMCPTQSNTISIIHICVHCKWCWLQVQ
uniref:Ig-like domain-containing protein n=1 Tax=Erpetoichthys calabaricus TaxID=27687 RepID=A0A8C4SWG0_ERPCA